LLSLSTPTRPSNSFGLLLSDKNGTNLTTTHNSGGGYYVVDQDQVFLATMMSSMNRVVNASNTGGFLMGCSLVAAVRIFSPFSLFYFFCQC
jgi:UDP-N-acetylglucosamine transferase subunit ALG13